ncbi:hypothetical protein [Mangrovimonas cancribranchiae]|uniref:Uncharacterized protein n=1 Tax=Mangrovimonas cancribranchiae TaxID=3080055 RepID=A0AAU6P6F9_9FLAO
MNFDTVLTMILGGTNIATLIGFVTERNKRKHEVSIKEADALKSMREQYTVFVEDMKKDREELKKEKDEVKKEVLELKKYSRQVTRKLQEAEIKCNNKCFTK